jgi:hypothetical protein
MSARTRAMLIDKTGVPSKPTDHGCGYFDDGCPWNICYACEYERNPAAYEEQIRKSNNVKLITGYFSQQPYRSVNAGATANGYKVDILDAVLAYLDTPIADRASVTLAADAKRALDTIASQR